MFFAAICDENLVSDLRIHLGNHNEPNHSSFRQMMFLLKKL